MILGVSADSEAKQAAFVAKYFLPFPLIADEDRFLCKTFGAWGKKKLYGKEYEGIIRTTVLVNPAGIVSRLWRNVKVDGHAEEVLAAIG